MTHDRIPLAALRDVRGLPEGASVRILHRGTDIEAPVFDEHGAALAQPLTVGADGLPGFVADAHVDVVADWPGGHRGRALSVLRSMPRLISAPVKRGVCALAVLATRQKAGLLGLGVTGSDPLADIGSIELLDGSGNVLASLWRKVGTLEADVDPDSGLIPLDAQHVGVDGAGPYYRAEVPADERAVLAWDPQMQMVAIFAGGDDA